jgi:hypothetical protein
MAAQAAVGGRCDLEQVLQQRPYAGNQATLRVRGELIPGGDQQRAGQVATLGVVSVR